MTLCEVNLKINSKSAEPRFHFYYLINKPKMEESLQMNMRLFKKYVTGLGGEGVKQNSDKQWQGGGVKPKSDVTAYEKNFVTVFQTIDFLWWISATELHSLWIYFCLTTKDSTLWRRQKVNSDEDEDKLVIFFLNLT